MLFRSYFSDLTTAQFRTVAQIVIGFYSFTVKSGFRSIPVENILAHAVIIDETEDSEGKIGLGCTIKVEDMETGDEELYAIVGSQEANPMECRISDDSPFGKALLGHKVGDIVEVEAPIGVLKYKILTVEK